jgi:hypothetical protein
LCTRYRTKTRKNKKHNTENPSLWTHYDNSKRIDDWTRHEAVVKLVPVSDKERKAIEDLVQNTWHENLVGIGKDATGLDSLAFNRIIVTTIERVENPKLFQFANHVK